MTRRKRYCNIKATTLEEVLVTCERHMLNIGKTQVDLIENEDGTESDFWYCKMFYDAWADLHDDVSAMLQSRDEITLKFKPSQCAEPPRVQALLDRIEDLENQLERALEELAGDGF